MRYMCISIFFIMLLQPCMAENTVEIHFNNSRDTVFIGMMNRMGVYIENDFIVNALGLPFELFQYNGTIIWDTIYNGGLVKLENDMADAYLAHGYEVNPGFYDQVRPDTLHIYGGYLPGMMDGLNNGSLRLCYSIRFYVSDSAHEGEFCVDNIFYPPDRFWFFMPDVAPDYFNKFFCTRP